MNINDILNDCRDMLQPSTQEEISSVSEALQQKSSNDKCIYCNNTGRTLNNPYKCVHCGREYLTIKNNKDKNYYLSHGMTEYSLEQANNWNLDSLKAFYQQRNKAGLLTQNILNLFERLLLETKYMVSPSKCNQIIYTTDKINYETILVGWYYYSIQELLKNEIKCNTELINLEFILKENIYNTNIMEYDVLFIELTNHLLSDCLNMLDSICTIRRHQGKATYCISRVSPSLISNNDELSLSTMSLSDSLVQDRNEFTVISLISSVSSIY